MDIDILFREGNWWMIGFYLGGVWKADEVIKEYLSRDYYFSHSSINFSSCLPFFQSRV
jgi:hypothetical protein